MGCYVVHLVGKANLVTRATQRSVVVLIDVCFTAGQIAEPIGALWGGFLPLILVSSLFDFDRLMLQKRLKKKPHRNVIQQRRVCRRRLYLICVMKTLETLTRPARLGLLQATEVRGSLLSAERRWVNTR